MWADVVNGGFEFLAGFVNLLNVWRLYKDKMVKGYNAWAFVFFTSWGFWNLYYYPSLNQWFSFWGGICICTSNMLWLALAYRYRNNG